MKKLFFKSILCWSFSVFSVIQCYSQKGMVKTYNNPVIPGDHSDCTLTKIGNDFYTTGSSFNPTPVIYHSFDLVHWEAIAQPVSAAWEAYGDRPSGGCWGGQLVFYQNKYWFFFNHGSMHFTTASKPEGPWSMPVKVNDPPQLPYTLGYDNSVFIDDDGKWYLVVKNGQPNGGIVELGVDGQPTGVVYDLRWLNPKPFKYSWAEGPVMWKHHGIYYYSFAHDVSGGQKVMHSSKLTVDSASWSAPVDFFNEKNPDKASAIFSGPNHSSAPVMLNDSTSWVLHPVWARANKNEWFGQGRQGLLNQVFYLPNNGIIADYPTHAAFNAPQLSDHGIPWMVPKSDFFDQDKLNPEWSFLGQTSNDSWSLALRPGWLRLFPKSNVKANTVIKTDAEHAYALITRIEFNPESTNDQAGIRIINGKENLWVKLYSSVNTAGKRIVGLSFDQLYFESEALEGNQVWLKLQRINHRIYGFFSKNGKSWYQVGETIDISKLDSYSQDYNGWCGNRQGLFVQGKSADFDCYIYRDAYTPIPAECTANQYGTSVTRMEDGSALLDHLNTGDWAMYAGVEFGQKVYPFQSDSVKFEVVRLKNGGNIEIWIDSIATGNRIALCKIKGNKEGKKPEVIREKTKQVTGRHDVFLRFIGKKEDELFQLKNLTFLPAK